MAKKNTKDILIETTMELLKNCDDLSEVTSRKITEKAGVNLAMINYNFDSKDELINIAIGKLLGDTANTYLNNIYDSNKEPKERLKEFLYCICTMVFDYRKYTKETIPYILLKGKFNAAKQLLPLIKECLKDSRSDSECRFISYELTSIMQLAFYRMSDLQDYLQVDMESEQGIRKIIDFQVDLLVN